MFMHEWDEKHLDQDEVGFGIGYYNEMIDGEEKQINTFDQYRFLTLMTNSCKEKNKSRMNGVKTYGL